MANSLNLRLAKRLRFSDIIIYDFYQSNILILVYKQIIPYTIEKTILNKTVKLTVY